MSDETAYFVSGDHASRPGVIGLANTTARAVASLVQRSVLHEVAAPPPPFLAEPRNVRVLAVGKLGPKFERVESVVHADSAVSHLAWPDDTRRPAGGVWAIGRHARLPDGTDGWISTYFAHRLGGS